MLDLVLLLLFGPLVDRLGHPDYRERVKVEKLCRAFWPLTDAALRRGVFSKSPQVQRSAPECLQRAKADNPTRMLLGFVARRPELKFLLTVHPADINWSVVEYLAGKPKGRLALYLLYHPNHTNNLPWLDPKVRITHKDDKVLRQTLCDYAAHFYHDEQGKPMRLAMDPDIPADPAADHLPGLENLRFMLRGLSDPQWLCWKCQGAVTLHELNQKTPPPRDGLLPRSLYQRLGEGSFSRPTR